MSQTHAYVVPLAPATHSNDPHSQNNQAPPLRDAVFEESRRLGAKTCCTNFCLHLIFRFVCIFAGLRSVFICYDFFYKHHLWAFLPGGIAGCLGTLWLFRVLIETSESLEEADRQKFQESLKVLKQALILNGLAPILLVPGILFHFGLNGDWSYLILDGAILVLNILVIPYCSWWVERVINQHEKLLSDLEEHHRKF